MGQVRQRNGGLRKVCGCPRRTWAKCDHGWRMNFKWKDVHHRYALDRIVGKPIRSKTEADTEADRIRTEIRAGTFRRPGEEPPAPVRDTLTLATLFEHFKKRYLEIQRPTTLVNTDYQTKTIVAVELERPDGTKRAFGQWLVADISTDALEQFQSVRRARGIAASNRDLSLLRCMFNWAASSKRQLVASNPFRDGDSPTIKLEREPSRRRRLQLGEGERLMAACAPHLRALVEAALECGARRGELLSMQWNQIRFDRGEIHLPAAKTKTRQDRWIPMSSRLRAILEMRRHDPAGEEHPVTAFVFGNEVGQRVTTFKRAWERALLVAHGHKPEYVKRDAGEGRKPVKTAVLTKASRAALNAIDLNFHDLRREAGSRWLEGGVPLHTVRDWLGHSSVAQTSIYLAGTIEGQHDAMRQFEARRDQGVQQSATNSGTGGHNRAQSAPDAHSDAQFSSIKHH